ncbi:MULTISPECIES: multicopper oxidase family protein [Bradyrhizobium]|uniref:multicopper oxidase family protein n=1 Tax=Bradyrhizobium TaxID=374 RepID=UPI0003F796D3|nr:MULTISPECIES: multicopper oxidase domain-containing protein [Bradyrhizobium]MBR1001957.1 multicopper oxidase domain-containing protein [Bradyrhizobium liaoningense]MCP1749185.1 FtsP/CotA-like multicopper oxidase with cupredoxin domain [Bradyrhizobium japonicum]MCP1855163.1 FtsP/CotA-like multicopper oxidase with cupredoxin domain [Bradyrhizobium japonicum]MCP1898088.1 FtsP/CotA-like multicopper oxidase with cupredoxin domain [Bradyrhizobium japonicum]MCW2330979.1 FtsP/CotA-like multicopper 
MFIPWTKTSAAILVSAVALLLAQVALGAAAGFNPCDLPPPTSQTAARQQYMKQLVESYGGEEFRNAPFASPTTLAAQLDLIVDYAENIVAGCKVRLRSYNGGIVGPTIRAHPGDTLYIRLVNKLPAGVHNPHPQDPVPPEHAGHFSFNITNLHTHGLNTSPEGDSDNVFLEIAPAEFQDDPKSVQTYRIKLHNKHPAGTFWYHAHVHGVTAIQLSSGMAGALIVEGGTDAKGGLDTVPEIQAANPNEKTLVLQQLSYSPDGQLESFDRVNLGGVSFRRHPTVNGQLVPTIHMRPGEVQRWRLIHAGVAENIALSLDGHNLYEIASDGIALGRKVPWPAVQATSAGVRSLLLAPGNRTDVLVQATALKPGETRKEYFLRDDPLPPQLSLRSTFAALSLEKIGMTSQLRADQLLDQVTGKPEDVIARIVVEGDPTDMKLPRDEALADRVPSELSPITAEEMQKVDHQQASFIIQPRRCKADGDCSENCAAGSDGCAYRFLVNNRIFMSGAPPRVLQLGRVTEWKLAGLLMPHPFHIHVNPFETDREEPTADGKLVTRKVWKDTLLLPTSTDPGNMQFVTVRARQLHFTGKFVLHCHILSHEDVGMMEAVEIVN